MRTLGALCVVTTLRPGLNAGNTNAPNAKKPKT